MSTPFPPVRSNVERLPKQWKYEWRETSVLHLTDSRHKLFVPGGHVQLVSQHRDFVMADIFVDRIINHAGMRFDGSTWAIDWGVMQRGAGYHDVLCEAVDQGIIGPENQPIADTIMRDIWLSDGAFVTPVLRGAYRLDVHARYRAVRWKQSLDHAA